MKRGLSFWDILAWTVIVLILIWLILKTAGIINTAAWLEYAPLYGAVYLAGWQIQKLATVASDVRELKKFKDSTINEINAIKTNCVKNHN
jgi:hypothetical protein